MPRFYWDFQKMREGHHEGSAPYTPAISVFYALNAALDLMDEEGAPARFARHKRAGDLVRESVLEMGLGLFADPPHNSNIVTAVTLPEGMAPKEVRDAMRSRYNTIIAGGPGRLKDSIIRIGHLGFFTEEDLVTTLEQLAAVVKSMRR
jgi:aspartate aminotransferase-like enzyme